MDNATAVRLLPQLAAKQEALPALQQQIADLGAQELELRREVQTLDRVTEIHNGVALTVWDGTIEGLGTPDWVDVYAIGDDISRSAKVYLNAHNKTTYGLRLTPWGLTDRVTGTHYTREDALTYAKAWVATGAVPADAPWHR